MTFAISPTLAQVARRTVLAFITLLALLVVGIVLLVMFFDVKGYAQRTASERSGREIVLGGDMHIDWSWVPRATFTDIRIANMKEGSEPTMARAEKLTVSLDLRRLLKGDTYLPELVLERPDILLEKDAKGNANWHFGDNPDGAATAEAVTPDDRTDIPAIGRLVIREGRLRYKDPTDAKIDIDTQISTATGAAEEDERIELSGKGTYQARPFILKLSGGSILTLQDDDKPYPLNIDATIGNTLIQVKGTLKDPVQMKDVDLALRLKGANAADLFYITGIALPPTPPYDVAGQLGFVEKGEDGIWTFKDFAGRMGGSDLGGDLSWDKSKKRPLFTANFVSKKLDFKDLGGLIGAPPKDKAVDPKQKQQAAKQEASPYVIPDAPLDISRLAAMDADVAFTGSQVISRSLPLDDFYMKVDLDNLLLRVHPVKFGTAGGDILANLEVNAREKPVRIRADFQFRRLSLARLFQGLSDKLGETNLAQGLIGGTAKLAGTGASLRDMLSTSDGAIGIGMEGGQLSNLVIELVGLDVAESLGFLLSGDKPTRVRCIIGDFRVEKGLARSNAIVIDTMDTNITGDGTLNLKDERLDITLAPHPKDPSLLSLRAPIHVRGTLKNPKVSVDVAALAARGGVAVALSAVLTPVGALLGLIETGLGKDSDCAGLLHEMNANTGRKGSKDLVPQNPGTPTQAEAAKAAADAQEEKGGDTGNARATGNTRGTNEDPGKSPAGAEPGLTPSPSTSSDPADAATAPVRPRR